MLNIDYDINNNYEKKMAQYVEKYRMD